jgi:hypothetical protein
MPTIVPWYLHLDLSKHVMRNVSKFRLRAHTLKVEAAAWLEDGSRICDQCPGEDEHVQNEVHALSFCQDHRVCELNKHLYFTVLLLYCFYCFYCYYSDHSQATYSKQKYYSLYSNIAIVLSDSWSPLSLSPPLLRGYLLPPPRLIRIDLVLCPYAPLRHH